MENIFNPIYRQDYILGYNDGQNPGLLLNAERSDAFSSGFKYGRMDYERLNGNIADGIPEIIVTVKILEEFLLAGMLGMDIDTDGYTPFQMNVIEKWYESGVEKYDPDQNIYLLALLEINGIEVR